MAKDDAAVLTTIAAFFAPIERDEWNAITADTAWQRFIDELRRLADGGIEQRPGARIPRRRRPLQECLSREEVKALYAPPSFDEGRGFAARHFTGGLPASAVAVESLYRTWSEDARRSPFPDAEPMYQSDAALYMRDLIARLGMEPSSEFDLAPDHLSMELAVAAALLEADMAEEACDFIVERFAWLGRYRARLLAIGEEAMFFIALVDALLCIRENHLRRPAA